MHEARATSDPTVETEAVSNAAVTEMASEPRQDRDQALVSLSEALLWTVGVFASHAMGSLLILGLILGAFWYQSDAATLDLMQLEPLLAENMKVVLGGDQLLVLLITVLAIGWRYGRSMRERLNLHGLHPVQVVAIVALVLPLQAVCQEVYSQADALWLWLCQSIPTLATLDTANTVEGLTEISGVLPLPWMLAFIAVAPALSEELVFRGVIGRGLVARYGLWTGVLVSSVLFAIVHFHPVHAIAVIPMGIALHLVYLSTRSLWGPILLHFLNNALASGLTKLSEGTAFPADLEMSGLLALPVSSLATVAAVMAVLWATRPEYVLPDGARWVPDVASADAPPAALGARRVFGACSSRKLWTAATAGSAFGASLVSHLVWLSR
jgi:uncharacterized protein